MRIANVFEGWSIRRAAGLLGALAVCLGAVTGLVLSGSREPAAAVRLLSGDAWLANGANGTVTHVNGYARRAGTTLPVVHPGDPFTVVQRPDGAYVIDRKTGAVQKVASSSEDVTANTRVADPSSQQIVTGGSTTWSVDSSSGVVQQLNPSTLASQGPPVPLGAPTGTATVDPNGSLWVPTPVQGAVYAITPGSKPARHAVGAPGDQISVAVTDGGAWAVDATSGVAADLGRSGQKVSFPPAAGSSDHPAVGASPTSADIVVVDGSNVEIIDTATGGLSTLSELAVNGVTQLSVDGTTAYLLNTATNQLITVDLTTATAGPPANLAPGPNQLVTDATGTMTFVNNPKSPNAYIVGPDGQPVSVTKYAVAPNPAPAPQLLPPTVTAPTPVALPSPVTVPAPVLGIPAPGPAVAPTGQSGAGPVAIPTVPVPVTPTVPAPTIPTPTPTPSPPAPAPGPNPPSASAPGTPVVTATPGDGSVTLSWAAPSANGAPITSYTVHGSTAASADQPVPATGGTESVTETAANNARYCATVQAVNRAGASPMSNQACATPTPGTPPMPTNVHAACSGLTCTVAWSAPASTDIGSYLVTASSGQSTQVGATVTSATFSGLAAGHSYSFVVQAVNQNGVKGPGAQSNAASTFGPPTAGALSVTSGPGKVTVTFAAGSDSGGDAIRYTIAVDGATKVANATPGHAYDIAAGAGQHKVTLTLTNAEGSAQATGTATSYSTDTVTECAVTGAGAGNYSYNNVNNPNCSNPLEPTPVVPGGVTFKTPAGGAVPGLTTMHDWLGTLPGGKLQTNALTSGAKPSSPAGTTWYEETETFSVATNPRPDWGITLAVYEYRDTAGQYRYVPAGDSLNWMGSGWKKGGIAFYICST